MTTWARNTVGWTRSGHPLDQQGAAEHQRGQPLTDEVGDRRPRQLEPRHAQPAVHQQRAQHSRHREPGDDVAQRPGGVLHAAHPAVARGRDQDRGHADDRDAHPRQCGGGDVTACGQRRNQRHRGGLHRYHDQRSQPDRQPGRLHTFTDRRSSVLCAEEPRRTRGGAIGQERHLRAQRAQDQPADGQTGQTDRAQPSDDGHVEQQIDGFGGQHPQCGQRQPGDAAAGGGRDRKVVGVSQGLRTGPARRRRPNRLRNSRRHVGARRRRRRWRSWRDPSTWRASTPTSAPARSP